MPTFYYGLGATYLGVVICCIGAAVRPRHACNAYRLTRFGAVLYCLGVILVVATE